MPNDFNLKSNQGATIIEFLIALSILSVTTFYVSDAISRFDEVRMTSKASSLIYSKDQLVRFETVKILQKFQKRLTELLPAKQCKDPYADFVGIAQASFANIQPIYFGQPNDLVSEPNFPPTLTTELDIVRNVTKNSKFYLSIGLTEAIDRCAKNQSITTGKKDITSKTSLFTCGYAKNMLVEMKFAFWDYNLGQALTCENMNERPGRGIQALYTIYHYVKLKKKTAGRNYSISKYNGRLYVSKNIH